MGESCQEPFQHLIDIFGYLNSIKMDEERGLELGAVDYITKPIKPAIVKARVMAHLEIKQARDRLKKQNAWLESEVARRIRENLMIQDISLCALAQLAETRDSDTGKHILRTKAYVEALARKLQSHPRFSSELDELHLSRIVKASPLHDIGKVGIPDHILLKPGKLTIEEWEIMKNHCRIGGDAIRNAIYGVTDGEWEIMKNHCRIGGNVIRHTIDKAKEITKDEDFETSPESLSFLEVAYDIATSHHERWDGTGYPDGLAGKAIPLPARLMALADVFDAVTTPRVYKKPWSTEEAAQLISEQKGKQFDPDIVEAFESIRETFENIQQALSDSEQKE